MRTMLLIGLAGICACGGHPPAPKRGVVEGDLGAWKFRRFQAVPAEVWVDDNKAEAFTASYVADVAEKKGHVEDTDVVNVFVTRYEKDDGVLRETVRFVRRLAAEGGYRIDENKIAGARTLTINGHGEAWVMWASKKHVIKVGGRGRDTVPEAMVESYADRYPSVVPGGALEGPLPRGPEPAKKPDDDKPAYDSNNPRPDLDKYDPNKAKVPAKKK